MKFYLMKKTTHKNWKNENQHRTTTQRPWKDQ